MSHVRPLVTLHQPLRQVVLDVMEREMPDILRLGEVLVELAPWQRTVDKDQALRVTAEPGCICMRNHGANVVPNYVYLLFDTQDTLHQCMQVVGHDKLGVAASTPTCKASIARRRLAVSCAAVVWHDNSISRIGERIDDVAVLVPRFWEAVDEEDRAFALCGRRLRPAAGSRDVDIVKAEGVGRCAGNGDGGGWGADLGAGVAPGGRLSWGRRCCGSCGDGNSGGGHAKGSTKAKRVVDSHKYAMVRRDTAKPTCRRRQSTTTVHEAQLVVRRLFLCARPSHGGSDSGRSGRDMMTQSRVIPQSKSRSTKEICAVDEERNNACEDEGTSFVWRGHIADSRSANGTEA